MAADPNTKANKRKLRELAGMAYRRELGAELSKLEEEFARWRSGEIDPFELSDRIHRFHDGISRDLYVLYGRLTQAMLLRAPWLSRYSRRPKSRRRFWRLWSNLSSSI
jgi:hypothetical protein